MPYSSLDVCTSMKVINGFTPYKLQLDRSLCTGWSYRCDNKIGKRSSLQLKSSFHVITIGLSLLKTSKKWIPQCATLWQAEFNIKVAAHYWSFYFNFTKYDIFRALLSASPSVFSYERAIIDGGW